jgi:hypothetical protein
MDYQYFHEATGTSYFLSMFANKRGIYFEVVKQVPAPHSPWGNKQAGKQKLSPEEFAAFVAQLKRDGYVFKGN